MWDSVSRALKQGVALSIRRFLSVAACAVLALAGCTASTGSDDPKRTPTTGLERDLSITTILKGEQDWVRAGRTIEATQVQTDGDFELYLTESGGKRPGLRAPDAPGGEHATATVRVDGPVAVRLQSRDENVFPPGGVLEEFRLEGGSIERREISPAPASQFVGESLVIHRGRAYVEAVRDGQRCISSHAVGTDEKSRIEHCGDGRIVSISASPQGVYAVFEREDDSRSLHTVTGAEPDTSDLSNDVMAAFSTPEGPIVMNKTADIGAGVLEGLGTTVTNIDTLVTPLWCGSHLWFAVNTEEGERQLAALAQGTSHLITDPATGATVQTSWYLTCADGVLSVEAGDHAVVIDSH
ncbi:hypothetical protein SAMN02910418_01074 [Bowdeniella nasicola]|uniref:Uncharacterized protein n=1 Tax=Bowdeniella nasicola TaxID=208480 RepID=A0A1H3Z340_9ACTO|nr:hypothetical protein SAMN02910418_01074 [Bowdeniella nasicola]